MRALKQLFHACWALLIAVAIVVPALPPDWLGGLPRKAGGWFRTISVSQHWGMYAPNPQRAQVYMNLTALYPDGSRVELEETAQERDGWGTQWAWRKRRVDIWRFYANMGTNRANRNRTWYLRGVCLREARRTGEAPMSIEMVSVRRKFTPPHRVREGRPDLGKPVRKKVQTVSCTTKIVHDMIQEDRERRAR